MRSSLWWPLRLEHSHSIQGCWEAWNLMYLELIIIISNRRMGWWVAWFVGHHYHYHHHHHHHLCKSIFWAWGLKHQLQGWIKGRTQSAHWSIFFFPHNSSGSISFCAPDCRFIVLESVIAHWELQLWRSFQWVVGRKLSPHFKRWEMTNWHILGGICSTSSQGNSGRWVQNCFKKW